MDEISECSTDRGVQVLLVPTDPYQAQLYNLVNDLRQQNGRPPFSWEERLTNAATGHITDLIVYGWFPDPHNVNINWVERIEQAGYTHWRALRENCANNSGQLSARTVEAMFNQLKRSPPHLANMLATDVRDFGTAVGQGQGTPSYCVMDFGRR